MCKQLISSLILSISIIFTSPAFATVVAWTDWQSYTSNSAAGQLLASASLVDVDVSSSSDLNFVQTGSGTNYWSGGSDPYTKGTVENDPTASELISLNRGGLVTINFSQTISDVFIALNSWNYNTVDFGTAIEIDSYGHGYWGSGTPILDPSGTGFYGSGEVHGVIKLNGNFDSISFTHTSENWHGFTVGVEALASDVPEPSIAILSLVLLSVGLLRAKKH